MSSFIRKAIGAVPILGDVLAPSIPKAPSSPIEAPASISDEAVQKAAIEARREARRRRGRSSTILAGAQTLGQTGRRTLLGGAP